MSKNNKNLNYKLFYNVLFEKYSGINKQKRGFIKSYYRSAIIHETFIGFLFLFITDKILNLSKLQMKWLGINLVNLAIHVLVIIT